MLFFTANQCQSPEAKAETLTGFVDEIIAIDATTMDLNKPIVSLIEAAKSQAQRSILLTKGNFSKSIEDAKQYKHALIFVGKHTIVKITDFDKTQKSTSWACAVPYGTGYIQNDGLDRKSDYINQIIGVPDNQTRWLFLFN